MITQECISFLICPFDGADLNRNNNSLYCINNHTFDISKEGYVNLLTSKKRFRTDVGDTQEMLLARDRFLSKKNYDFLSKSVNEIAFNYLKKLEPSNKLLGILEPGVGTAFYLYRLKSQLDTNVSNHRYCYFGTDISKEAIKLSSKKYSDISYMVVDTYDQLPMKKNSMGIILNIFSPRNPKEFHRLLNESGILITVIPNKDHLHELIETFNLHTIEEDKKENIHASYNPYFNKILDKNYQRKIILDSDTLLDLLRMGPNQKYINQNIITIARSHPTIKVTASFTVLVYRRL